MKLPEFNKIKTNVDFEKLLTLFVLVDICLLPYIRPLRCLTSMLLLLVWFGFKIIGSKPNLQSTLNYLQQDKEAGAFFISCVCIAISTIVGLIALPATVPSSYSAGEISVFSRTVTYSAIYVFAFLYYFFFREMVPKYSRVIYKTVRILFVTFVVFSLVYLISPVFFYKIRSFWTLSGRVQNITTEASSYFRYTYSFSDPNNFAAIAVAITILIAENTKESKRVRIGALVACTVMLVAAMSVQGVLSFCCYIGVKLLGFASKIIKKEIEIEKKYIRTGLYVLAAMILAIPVALQIPVVKTALTRVFNNGGSFLIRWNMWTRLLQEKGFWGYLLCGRGCAIMLDGVEVLPHNGHLHILYCYGFIAYLMFMYVFFRKRAWKKWSNMMFLIPLFICFTINVGLLEARYSFCMAVIVAFGCRRLRRKQKIK